MKELIQYCLIFYFGFGFIYMLCKVCSGGLKRWKAKDLDGGAYIFLLITLSPLCIFTDIIVSMFGGE